MPEAPPSPAPSSSFPDDPPLLPTIYDVLIIGAGPAGLAVAARLCERTPSALFTDEEHRRYHWIRKSGTLSKRARRSGASKSSSIPLSADPASTSKTDHSTLPTPPLSRKSSSTSLDPPPGQTLGPYHALVLDATANTFLGRWHALFARLAIPHLRSPMFFHIDPADRDALLAYAIATHRYAACVEIHGVVGKEVSKHAQKRRRRDRATPGHGRAQEGSAVRIDERDRKDYLTPSTELFAAHCAAVVQRYGLDEPRLLRVDDVQAVTYGRADELGLLDGAAADAGERIFCVRARGGTYAARVVVVAAGPAMRPVAAPRWPRDACCHSSAIGADFPSAGVRARAARGRATAVVVVGGGLTSAQLCDLALRRGVSDVWLLLRGDVRVQPFDVALAWMGKFRNREKAAFWSADGDAERWGMLRQARGGGSIPLPYVKMLRAWEKQGRLHIATRTTLRDITPGREPGRWTVQVEPRAAALAEVDYVYFATGPGGLAALEREASAGEAHGEGADVEPPLPCLGALQRAHPIPWLHGLPALTDDLAWSAEVPLFVTGALAALRLGPGAANLEGARLGAERVAWGIEDVLPRGQEADAGREAWTEGRGGRFDGLLALGEE